MPRDVHALLLLSLGLLAGPSPADQAVEAWAYRPREGWKMSFQGVADEAGNLYWAECTAKGVCDVVSGTSNGEIRFRAPLPGVRRYGNVERGQLVVAGELVTEGLAQGTIRAFKTSDGTQAWSHDLRADLCGGRGPHDSSSLAIRSITSGRSSELFLEADGDPCGSKSRGHWVISLWASTGRLRWVKEYERAPSGLVASGDGDLFFQAHFSGRDEWSRPYLVSLSSSGRERWARAVSWSSLPVAAFAGRLFSANREVWRSSTGEGLSQLPIEDAWRGQRDAFTLVDEGFAFVIASRQLGCTAAGCSVALHKIDLGLGKPSWKVVLSEGEPASITQPVLTSNETILFAQSAGSSTLLRELTGDGREIRSASLPNGRYAGAAALTSHRWITAIDSPAQEIRAFEVGPEQARRSGWIGWGGNTGCSSAPQEERRAVAARRPPSR